MDAGTKRAEERLERPLASAPTGELLAHLAKDSAELVKKEVELAKAELRRDIHRELRAAADLGIAAALAIAALSVLVVAAVFGLSAWLPAWAAALIAAAVVLAIAMIVAVIGWARRVAKPLPRTQKTLQDDVQWVKERLM